MLAPFGMPLPAQPPRRSLGTSGVFHVPPLSPSVDPAILGPVLPRDKIRNLAAAALKALHEQGKAAEHATRQTHGDQSVGEAERHRRANKVSADLIMAALPIVERARGAHEKSIAELHAMLAGPTIEVSEIRQTGIRSKLSGLPAGKRFASVAKSIARGDDSVVRAVLASDRLLTDFLSDVEIDAVRSLWAKSRHPDEVRLLAQRESDLGHLERAASVVQSWQRKTHNPAIAAAVIQATGGQSYGAPGPAPVNRASSLEERARATTALIAARGG
jgi:hypothetical protein